MSDDAVSRTMAETQRVLEKLWRRRDRAQRQAIGQLETIIHQIYNPSTGGVHTPSLPTLAGDVIGSITANVLAAIRGTPVSGVAPLDGQVLVYNDDAGQWEPGAPGDPAGEIVDYSTLVNEARTSRGATFSASSTSGSAGQTAAYAADSDDSTYWLSLAHTTPDDPADAEWWRTDLGSAKEITWYRVVQAGPTQYRATSSKLQSSTDDVNWTDRATFGVFGDSGLDELPSPVTARYWRVLGVDMDPLPFVTNYWGLATVALYSGQPTTQAPGHLVEDEGTPLTQRSTLNFVGDDVAAADSGGKTTVTIMGAIRQSLIDAKGDLVVGTAADTPGILSVGADGQIPYADSDEVTGIRWGAPPTSGGASQGTYLVSGGQVTWQTGYQYLVAAGTGYINGVLYSWAAQTVTLDASDPSNDRIDVIYVGDDSLADSITGTAAANPSEPVVDPGTQLKLALVTVGAGTTEPTVSSELLYAENAGSGGAPAEWDWTTSGSGWSLGSTSNPRSGTTDIEGTSVATNAYVQGQRGAGTIDPTAYQQLVLYLRFKASWGANRYLQVTLRNGGVQVGNALRISSGFFGLDQANTTTYQAVIIPTLQFATAPGALIDQVRIQALGSGGAAIGCYLDDLSFTSAGAVVVGGGGLSQDEADARYARRALNLSDLEDAATARTNIGALAATHTSDADPHPGYVRESEIDAKGDLLAGTADNTLARLPVGTDGQMLYADSGEAAGLRWDDAPSGGGVTDHGALTGLDDDDHPQYQEEDEKGVANGYASLDADALVPFAELPVGTAADEVAAGNHTHAGGGSSRWELVVDQEAGELIWAGSAGSYDLIYAEIP